MNSKVQFVKNKQIKNAKAMEEVYESYYKNGNIKRKYDPFGSVPIPQQP